MGKKKTHEDYEAELSVKNPNVEVIGTYVNANTAITHHCLIHDVLWETTPGRALSGVGCIECKRERFRKTRCKTHEQYIQEVSICNPNVVVVGLYVDAKTKLDFYCIKHNIFWSAYPDNVLRGCGCAECGKEKIGSKNRKTHEQYVCDLMQVNPNIEVLDTYQGADVSILHRCKLDGYQWLARPGNILSGKGCPRCNDSHGEKFINKWLVDHDIEYVTQKTFDDCKAHRLLPFDFYLPNFNVCIEYDGEQHFRPVDFFGGEDGFKNRKKYDEIKNQYCKVNDITLLRIPFFKNVEEELNNFFIHLI